MEQDELMHFGIKGMKWKNHIYKTDENNFVKNARSVPASNEYKSGSDKYKKVGKSSGVNVKATFDKTTKDAKTKENINTAKSLIKRILGSGSSGEKSREKSLSKRTPAPPKTRQIVNEAEKANKKRKVNESDAYKKMLEKRKLNADAKQIKAMNEKLRSTTVKLSGGSTKKKNLKKERVFS